MSNEERFMLNMQTTRASTTAAVPTRRIGQRSFWVLLGLEGLFLGALLVLAIQLLSPVQAPLAQSADYATVRSAIQSRLSGAIDDPLIDVAPGATARLSNVGGFNLNGYTYYYYREGQSNFDPVSRGTLAADQVELVDRTQLAGKIVVIYRVHSNSRATD
jgi:hypothetical protein